MADLLPCPFCGKQPERLESKFWTGMRHDVIRVEYRCHCDGLTARQRGFVQISGVTDAEALEAWNRRVPAKTALDSFIDDVEAYLEAQDALDNQECMGINAEPYDVLMRRRNVARDDLEKAKAAAMKGDQP